MHNCYASQQRRLKRRKLKDALKGRTRSKLKGRAASVGAAAQAAEPVVGNPFLRTTLCASALEHPFAGKSGEKNAVSLPAAPLPDVNAAHAAAQMVPSNNLHAGGRGGCCFPRSPIDYLPGSSLATPFSLEPRTRRAISCSRSNRISAETCDGRETRDRGRLRLREERERRRKRGLGGFQTGRARPRRRDTPRFDDPIRGDSRGV